MKTVIVTGGAGFIGSNLVHWLLRERDWRVVNLDALTYAGNLENLTAVESEGRYRFVHCDIAESDAVRAVFDEEKPQLVMHLAAESHVDRSILDPSAFVRTNVLGTQNLIDAARATEVERFLHVSTDEVYGALGAEGKFTEQTPLAPNSPYSASKASSDLLVRAAHRTHGFDAVITRCSNNYGPYQFPEKLIPLMISNALEDKPLPIYGDGMQVRDWIHVEDHARALVTALEKGEAGGVYNIGSDAELPNLTVVRTLLELLGKGEDLIQYVQDRPGHDRRYAIDATRIRSLGWAPQWTFAEGIRATIDWYRSNQEWGERVRSGAYRDYYQAQYGGRLG